MSCNVANCFVINFSGTFTAVFLNARCAQVHSESQVRCPIGVEGKHCAIAILEEQQLRQLRCCRNFDVISCFGCGPSADSCCDEMWRLVSIFELTGVCCWFRCGASAATMPNLWWPQPNRSITSSEPSPWRRGTVSELFEWWPVWDFWCRGGKPDFNGSEHFDLGLNQQPLRFVADVSLLILIASVVDRRKKMLTSNSDVMALLIPYSFFCGNFMLTQTLSNSDKCWAFSKLRWIWALSKSNNQIHGHGADDWWLRRWWSSRVANG